MCPIPEPSAPDHLPMREWAYVHSELEWIYDHEVPEEYRERHVDKQRSGYWAWYVRKGRATVVGESGARLEAGEGSWLMVPTERLTQRFSDDARILSLHFRCQWPAGENILAGNGGLVVRGADCPELERKAARLERMVRRHLPEADRMYYGCFSDFEQFLSFHALFQQWLTLWFRIQKQHGAAPVRLLGVDNRLLNVQRHLNHAPLHKGLPVEALRRESGLSDAHLNRMFLARHGLTVRKYWERRRLQVARGLLETSLMPKSKRWPTRWASARTRTS